MIARIIWSNVNKSVHYFGAGLAVYERESWIKGTGIPYEDGTHVMILSSRYRADVEQKCDPAILEVLDYVRTNADNPGYQSELANRIVERVEAIRQNDELEGVYMSTELYEQDLLAKGRAEGRAEGREEGIKEGVLRNARRMKEKGFPIEDIMEITGLTFEEVSQL